jgi:lipoyl(octanoyl) transferase
MPDSAALSDPTFRRADAAPIAWRVSAGPIPYPDAIDVMEARAEAIARDGAPELIWLLEHPPLYTAGVSAKAADLLWTDRFPVYHTRRGGQFTYHGPGQRVAYVMLDLRKRGRDVRAFVGSLEHWLIATLGDFGVAGEVRAGRVGVWVRRPALAGTAATEAKIAAIGVKLRSWVSFHGVSLNVAPDLHHFQGIVPCGIADRGVTSLADLGLRVGLSEVDDALRAQAEAVFGPLVDEAGLPPGH